MAQTQVRNALYKLEVDPQNLKHVIVYKLGADMLPLQIYHVNIMPTFSICSCYAGTKDCRHQKMMRLWNDKNAWGKGYMYNYDKAKWIEPTEPA